MTRDDLKAAFHAAARARELAVEHAEHAQKRADEARRAYVEADKRLIDAWCAYRNALEGEK